MPIGNLKKELFNISENILRFNKTKGCQLILVVDGQSDTESINFLETMLSNQVTILLNGNFGNPGSCRNHGLLAASGDWITFIDSDDEVFFEDFIELVSEAQKESATVAIGSYILETIDRTTRKEFLNFNKKNVLESVARVPGIWRMSFKRVAIPNYFFPELRMGEDQVFLSRIGFANHSIYPSNKIVYKYRRNVQGQLTSNRSVTKDLVLAQHEVISRFMKIGNQNPEAHFLSIMIVNQLFTSARRVGISGIKSNFHSIASSHGNARSTLVLCRTLINEITNRLSEQIAKRVRVNEK